MKSDLYDALSAEDKAAVDANMTRYADAMHAVMTGVGYEQSYEPGADNVKQLRTGINSAMINDAALAGLLMEKGVFTIPEYVQAIADAAEEEATEYEARLTDRLGGQTKIHLK